MSCVVHAQWGWECCICYLQNIQWKETCSNCGHNSCGQCQAVQGFCAAVCELSRPLRAFSAPRSQYEYSMSTGTLIPPYTRHPTNPKVGKIKHVKWFLTALKDNEFTDLPALNT